MPLLSMFFFASLYAQVFILVSGRATAITKPTNMHPPKPHVHIPFHSSSLFSVSCVLSRRHKAPRPICFWASSWEALAPRPTLAKFSSRVVRNMVVDKEVHRQAVYRSKPLHIQQQFLQDIFCHSTQTHAYIYIF